jgi:RNA 3'-terminal phosphate cyclase (ATP)
MLHIDASTLEGGGQLTRLALTLSALTGKAVHLTNIRAGRGPMSHRSETWRTHHNANSGHAGGRGGRDNGARGGRAGRGGRNTGRVSNRGDGEGVIGKKDGTGLKESHLAALHFLAEACDAHVSGGYVGSKEVIFKPRLPVSRLSGRLASSFLHVGESVPLTPRLGGKGWYKEVVIELKNPGSVWLIWQVLYPFIVFGYCRRVRGWTDWKQLDERREEGSIMFIIKGGTNVDKSMSTEYVTEVFLPMCKLIGLPEFHVDLNKRGWAGSRGLVGEVRIWMQFIMLEMEDVSKASAREKAVREEQEQGKSERREGADENMEPEQEGKAKQRKMEVTPFALPTFNIPERGAISHVRVVVIADGWDLCEQLSRLTQSKLRAAFAQLPPDTFADDFWMAGYDNRLSEHPSRLYILIWAETSTGIRIGRDYLGSGKIPKSNVQMEAMKEHATNTVVRDFVKELERGNVVDEFMRDQLVIFQALAEGRSVVGSGRGESEDVGGEEEGVDGEEEGVDGEERRGNDGLSLHAKTAMWVAEQVLGMEFDEEGNCAGVGLNTASDGMELTLEEFIHDLGRDMVGLRIEKEQEQ